MQLLFAKSAARDWRRLPDSVRKRLRKKLAFFISQKDPLHFAIPMQDSTHGDYRFRIGEYRVLFDIEDDTIVVVRVGNRKDVYR